MGVGALNVDVRLFAGYKEKAGTSRLALDLPEGATVGYLAAEMLRLYPGMLAHAERLVVAVNYEYQDHLYALGEGDEVALIPPVSGGARD